MSDNPTDDLPSSEGESCDLGDCSEPWAAEVDRQNGPRKLRLCEAHHDRWTTAERELYAEIESVAGRDHAPSLAPLFGLARAFAGPVFRRRTGEWQKRAQERRGQIATALAVTKANVAAMRRRAS